MDPEPATIPPLAPAFVPRFRDEVAFVPVADEGLLYVEQTGTLHQLDAIGAVICRVFDGDTSIELAAEHLANAFEAPRDQVEADVLAFAERLGGFGLLAGIEVEDDAAPEDGGTVNSVDDAAPEDGDPSASLPPDA